LSIGRSLAALEIARPDQHSEGVRREILCDLKTDSLISPGDQGDGFVLHSNLLFAAMAINDERFGPLLLSGTATN
jgi:hypothetical protein